MADNKAPRNNAHCTLPDDPEQSTYRFIIVAAKRARQLQGGARPVLPTSSKKPTIIAMEEVRRGLVKYDLTGPLANSHHDPLPEQSDPEIETRGGPTLQKNGRRAAGPVKGAVLLTGSVPALQTAIDEIRS